MAKAKKLFCKSVFKKWSANIFFLKRKHEFDYKQSCCVLNIYKEQSYNEIIKSNTTKTISFVPFVKKVSEITNMPFGVISSLISDVFDLIIVTMSKEKDVYFTGFGRFCYAKKDGEPLISFKPDKNVTEAIRKLTEERRARMEK